VQRTTLVISNKNAYYGGLRRRWKKIQENTVAFLVDIRANTKDFIYSNKETPPVDKDAVVGFASEREIERAAEVMTLEDSSTATIERTGHHRTRSVHQVAVLGMKPISDACLSLI
jgi:hypothetical protein